MDISLTQGKQAIIDDADADLVVVYRWHAVRIHNIWYAASRTKGPGGGKRLYMHRLVMGVAGEKAEVDHISGDGLDNRRANLRLVSHAENLAKAHRPLPRSGLRGVWFHERKKRWYARLTAHGRSVYLGCYGDALSAARAYDAYAYEVFGPCAFLNFPPVPSSPVEQGEGS